MSTSIEVGIIGGSGFYDLEELNKAHQVEVVTPYGSPSTPLVVGELAGRKVAFLARHGEGHNLLPSELPTRANIHAFKQLGVEQVLSFSAVGSLQEHYEPLQAVVPDQIIDRTRGLRPQSFFGDGLVAHVGFADPFCPNLALKLVNASRASGVTTHQGGTLIVIEGPTFSTRAESELYRSWGAAIIGMTALPEARLAREAELCYAALCFVTDYDVWHDAEEDVSAALVLNNLKKNANHGQTALVKAVASLGKRTDCPCPNALETALVTAPELVPAKTRRRLAPLIERYWGEFDESAPS